MAKKEYAKFDKDEVRESEKRESDNPTPIHSEDVNLRFHQMLAQSDKGKVVDVNIAEAAEEYACIFGANKNVYRVTPSVQDGLRPGKRRVLYMWWLAKGKPMKTDSATINRLKKDRDKVYTIMCEAGKIHPHGEQSTYGTIVYDGQEFRNNARTVGSQGNFGNLIGAANGSSGAAAARYIEMYMPEYTVDCFFDDFESYCVPMKPTYDGKLMEPEYLPAKYPHALFNPQFSGIGYGFASNIPPFNVTEVLEATIKLIKDPDAKIMLIPDFKFGCDIIDTGDFKEINKTGSGKLVVQGKYTIDPVSNVIKIKSLPLNTYSKPYIDSIIPHTRKGGALEGKVKTIHDNSGADFVDITIQLYPTAKADEVIEFLLKKTNLRQTHSVALNLVDDYVGYEFGVKSFLKTWIDYRRDCMRSMFNYKLVQTIEKKHLVEALLVLSKDENRDDAIKIATTSKNRQENIQRLVTRFKITSLQAAQIVDMRIHQLNKDKRAEYKQQKKELTEKIDELMDILNNDSKVDEIIISQLEEGIKKYGHPRHSKVLKLDDPKDDVPSDPYLVGISASGYIKKIKLTKDNQSIGNVGRKYENFIAMVATDKVSLLIITSTGLASKVPVSAIPNMKMSDTGIDLERFFEYSGDVIGAIVLSDHNAMANSTMLLMTEQGYAKRIQFDDIKCKDGKTTKIINIPEDDKLIGILSIADDNLDIVAATMNGYGVRVPCKDIRLMKLQSRGNRIISLSAGDKVSSISLIDPNQKKILYITSAGKMKLTESKYFPVMDSAKVPLQLISLDGSETLIGVCSASPKSLIQVYGKKGEIIYDPVSVSSIPVKGRVSKGVPVIKKQRGDVIIAYKILKDGD